MGNATGTYTQKATISPQLYPFSKWGEKEIHQLLIRGQSDLSESFGLRKHEVEYLIGINEEISFKLLRSLFEDVFDTDHNSLIDKMELMCVICMVSKVSTADKCKFFFDLFNFNNKGFLNDSELTLLIMAVTRGVYKVDQKFTPPSAKVIKDLVKEAFGFAVSEPGNLRKPELLRFAVNNPSVYAYLECWRGHASQVLLLDGTKWRDLSFPCDESAICWNYSWGVLGLPPSSFVHWRRIDHIGTEIVTSHLFAHELTYLKTIDRKKVYSGDGILGTGYFKRGCLADLWFLNGLSALVANPDLVLACFGETGQEENGRYCCRFYEGGSWRSVYVDDRIPCNTFLSPIFSTSGCKFEYWPLIMQKASAKYLGSYGHIAWCSDRTDASLMSLRMLTGGHVKRYYIFNYDWRSVILESVKESGTQFILDSLKKGHVISFLRSATQSMMNLSLKQNKSTLNLLPVGHFFPVVGHIKNTAGYIYLIFKDTWGLVADADPEVDIETGRCRTFKIKIEDITMFFDCFVIAFYPDSLRSKATKLGIKPWMTEAATAVANPATKTIAKYVLKVRKNNHEEKTQTSNDRFKGKHEIINDTILEANEIAKTEETIHIPRLKEKANYIRETDRPMPGQPKQVKTKLITNESTSLNNHDDFDDVISLAFTASSSYDWSYAGSQEARPSIKIRIIPSQETKHFIRQREAELAQRKKLKQEYLQKRRMAQAQLMEVNTFGEGSLEENESKLSMVSTSEQNSLNGSATKGGMTDLGEDSTSLLYRNPSVAEDRQYELFFSGERCWLSQNIQLVEGEYIVLIDLQFQQPLQEIRRRSLPRDLGEAPWIDYRIAKLLQHNNFIADPLNIEKFVGGKYDQDDDTRSLQSLKELEKRLFADKDRSGKNIVDTANVISTTEGGGGATNANMPTAAEDIVPNDIESLLENKVWFECSSHDLIKLRPFNNKRKKDKSKFEVSEPVFPSTVQRETWPLTCESQVEIASIKLTEMMTELKVEAQILAEEFVSIARKYKEERKLEAMNQTGKGNKLGKGSPMKKDIKT